MKLDPARPRHYLILAAIGGASGIAIAALLLFFTSVGDPLPPVAKVLCLAVASIGLSLFAYTHRPNRGLW